MIMKKYIIKSACACLCLLGMVACSADMDVDLEKDNAANSGQPQTTIYQYEAPEGYNPDNDTKLRFVFNSLVSKAYYLAQLQSDKDSYIKEKGEDAYLAYVVENGTEVTIDPDSRSADVMLEGLLGLNSITVVSVTEKGVKKAFSTTFNGLVWNDVCTGDFHLSVLPEYGFKSVIPNVLLQVADSDPTLYRLKDPYASGSSIKFRKLEDHTGENDGGPYHFIRVEKQRIGLQFGSYGDIYIQDIGYWQGDDSFVLEDGFEGGIYENNIVFFYVEYEISAGALGYNYEYFVPNV